MVASNTVYQGWDPSAKRLNFDGSEKWKFIKSELLTSDSDELIKMLQVAIDAYKREQATIIKTLANLVEMGLISKRRANGILKGLRSKPPAT